MVRQHLLSGRRFLGLPRVITIPLVLAVALVLVVPIAAGIAEGNPEAFLGLIPPTVPNNCYIGFENTYNLTYGPPTGAEISQPSAPCPDAMPAGGTLTWTIVFSYPTAVSGVPSIHIESCEGALQFTVASSTPGFPQTLLPGQSVTETLTLRAPDSGGPAGAQVVCDAYS